MMYSHADDEPVLILDEEQCWKLLGHSQHGRLATAFDGVPYITPVNHGTADGRVYLRSAAGSKLSGLTVNPRVAFESDGILSDEAWSVIILGTARILDTEAEIKIARASGVDPWVQTLKDFWIEITPTLVSGRHFILGQQPEQLDES
ncbi:pyridoxamine 5'-phosphate oxidase family protein [Arthrobacter rhombi]|uniref:pyridoxamine 5'-phosphate oxidase family protein n=1 Tax=Arthrobacter rhombi TaxID=71253 RepID=UPI003FD1F5CE